MLEWYILDSRGQGPAYLHGEWLGIGAEDRAFGGRLLALVVISSYPSGASGKCSIGCGREGETWTRGELLQRKTSYRMFLGADDAHYAEFLVTRGEIIQTNT